MGQMTRLRTELPESASPLLPRRWSELNTVTIAFGHGMAVAPLQAVMGINALVNGGYLIPPTFLKRTEKEAMAEAKRVIRSDTSEKMRFLMRLNAEIGTARKADVKGYYIGGKTGTSEKVVNGRYAKKKVLNSFTAVLPADNPRYQLLVMLDEPQSLPETHGFITSGWNAVPTGGKVIERIAPLLGITTAVRFAAVRAPYSCGIEGKPVTARHGIAPCAFHIARAPQKWAPVFATRVRAKSAKSNVLG